MCARTHARAFVRTFTNLSITSVNYSCQCAKDLKCYEGSLHKCTSTQGIEETTMSVGNCGKSSGPFRISRFRIYFPSTPIGAWGILRYKCINVIRHRVRWFWRSLCGSDGGYHCPSPPIHSGLPSPFLPTSVNYGTFGQSATNINK